MVTDDQKKVQQNLQDLLTTFAISGVAQWSGDWQPVTVEHCQQSAPLSLVEVRALIG